MTFSTEKVDVLVVGGGPVGLLIAYGLLRAGVSACVVEKDIKSEMPMYGRASTLYPRSLELLDALDLLAEMNQLGFIQRSAVTYKGYERITTRGWHTMFQKMPGTFCDYTLNLRLKYSEEIFQKRYEAEGGLMAVGWEVTDITVDHNATDGYKATTTTKNVKTGEEHTIKSKYVVGADGGKSKVRHAAGIKMDYTGTPYHWVRIDAVIKTNLPDTDLGEAAIESPTHGNTILVRLDHSRTRIGFALNDELYKKYGDEMSQEQAMYEAQQAMKPWTCEFGQVDWHTLYRIHQAVAQNFVKDDVFIIAGDAGHLHSSGAAQGMNTGIHDATNLAWKLAGVVKGYLDPKVLETYESERRPIAQHLIDLDKQMSSLITGVIPDDFKTKSGEAAMDPHELFGKIFDDATDFNIGLGISYPKNIINKSAKAGMITPGYRAPDEIVYAPGLRVPIRLQTLLKNDGRFHIVVFAGEPLQTGEKLLSLRKYLDTSPTSILKLYGERRFKFTTIMVGNSAEGQAKLGCNRFGNFYFDVDHSAHVAYGITPRNGAVMVFRPDGIVAYCTLLEQGEDLAEYFGGFMIKTGVANGS